MLKILPIRSLVRVKLIDINKVDKEPLKTPYIVLSFYKNTLVVRFKRL